MFDFQTIKSITVGNAKNYLEKVKQLYANAKIYVISPIWHTNYETIARMSSFQIAPTPLKTQQKI